MNIANTSKITLVIFFAIHTINTQLFTAEKQRTLIQKINVATIATAVTITSIFAMPALAENTEKKELKVKQNILWELLPEAFRRFEMCKILICQHEIENDAKRIIRACFDIDLMEPSRIHDEVRDSFAIETSDARKSIKTELNILEKNFDYLSLEKILELETSKPLTKLRKEEK